jgi:hypothetical protein
MKPIMLIAISTWEAVRMIAVTLFVPGNRDHFNTSVSCRIVSVVWGISDCGVMCVGERNATLLSKEYCPNLACSVPN